MFFEDCETCKDNNDCENRKDDNDCKGFNCREEVFKSRT
jgi:hypothetical protein